MAPLTCGRSAKGNSSKQCHFTMGNQRAHGCESLGRKEALMQKVQVKKLIEVTATFLVGGEEEADASTTVFVMKPQNWLGALWRLFARTARSSKRVKTVPWLRLSHIPALILLR